MVPARCPPFIGGTESHVADVSERLVRLGHRITVLTTDPARRAVDRREENGVTVVRVPARKLWRDVYVAAQLPRHVALEAPDLVHVQGYHTLIAPMAMRAASTAGIPYVVSFHSGGHDSRVRRAVRPVQRRLLRSALRRAVRLVAVSEFERRMFARSLGPTPAEITVIPTGVADEFIQADRTHVDVNLIVSVGRLVEYKGHRLLIEALPHVRRVHPAARLRILGQGDDRDALLALAGRLGVGDAVEISYVPAGDRAALAGELGRAAVAVFLSSYESQGIAGYEAVAAGARAVIARGTALEELACFPGVCLVDRGDQPALVDSIVTQLAAPPLDARPMVPRLEETAGRLEKLYFEVLGAERASD